MQIKMCETQRLILRHWRKSDIMDFERLVSDYEVMLASGGKHANTRSKVKRELEIAMQNIDCFAIVLKETREAIGKIKFQDDNRRHRINSVSIGYELARDFWGHGYMTEALKAMIVLAFEKKRVDVLGISHFSINKRSARVIQKCCFTHEGTMRRAFLRQDGEILDDECYSILKEEYFHNQNFYRQQLVGR